MKEFIIRSISGLLYAVLIIAAAVYSNLSFIIVILIFCSLALYEFQKLIQYKSPVPFILFWFIVYQFYNKKLNPYLHISLLCLSVISNIFLTYFLFSKKIIPLMPYQKIVLTLFYLVASSYFIIATSSLGSSIENGITISMYFIVWVNNSFAYIFGKKWGRKLLFKEISPKKTWEGFLGGAIMCFASSFLLIFYHPSYPSWTFPLISILIVVTSTVGDLVQSKFKRQASVKDSGSLIPGHGGFYDRMDSVLFTAPFVFLALMIISYVS